MLVVVVLIGVASMALLATSLRWVVADARVARMSERRAWMDAVARSNVDVATAVIASHVAHSGSIPEVAPELPSVDGAVVTWHHYSVAADGAVDFVIAVAWSGWTSTGGGRWPRPR